MRFIPIAAGVALALASVPALAEDAKPNDAQIAHIAYTAGVIDIKAGQLALQKSKNKEVRTSRRTWCRTIRRSMIRRWRWLKS